MLTFEVKFRRPDGSEAVDSVVACGAKDAVQRELTRDYAERGFRIIAWGVTATDTPSYRVLRTCAVRRD